MTVASLVSVVAALLTAVAKITSRRLLRRYSATRCSAGARSAKRAARRPSKVGVVVLTTVPGPIVRSNRTSEAAGDAVVATTELTVRSDNYYNSRQNQP